MNIDLQLLDGIRFMVKSPGGFELETDGPESIGGQDKGFRPMELVLAGLATCAAVDVVHILKKGRQDFEKLDIKVTSERVDAVPAVFKSIHVKFLFHGELNQEKADRALNLSFEKYCSVSKMLHNVEITYSAQIN